MSYSSIIRSASFVSRVVGAAALLAALFVSTVASAVTLYWNQNGNLAGTGTWDTTTTNWSTTNTVGPADATWNPNDGTVDAVIGGDPGQGAAASGLGGPNGQITVSGTVNVRSLTMAALDQTAPITVVHYSLYGGTIHITDPTNSIVMNTNSGAGGNLARTQIIASVLSGTDITVVPNPGGSVNSFLTLGAPSTGVTNTFTGDLIFGGSSTASVGLSQININNPTALPPTATVRMRRNLSQLIFGGGNNGVAGNAVFQHTFPNNIVLNDNASGTLTSAIGVSQDTTVVTLSGVISGNANLIFQLGNGGGNGTLVLSNHATYTGTTNLSGAAAAVVRLGIDDALPVGTTFSVNRTFNMAGFDQRIGGLNSNNVNGGVTNTEATTSTLTIDGNVTGTFTGLIGATALSGSNNDLALVLASTNTGTLTLARGSENTYTGGTTINGGRLIAANDPSTFLSATGSGPVAVNNGGTLGGGGAVAGAVTVASGGHIAPSGVFNNGTVIATNPIGALTALGGASLASGSILDIDLGAPAPTPTGGTSDRLAFPNATGAQVPAGTGTIGVNFDDPAGGAAGNGTYTLMTFLAGGYNQSNATQFFTSSMPQSLNGATVAYHLADDSFTVQDGTPANATRVIAQVTGGPNALVWAGTADANWETANNFTNLNTGSAATFANNDNVTFSDSGGGVAPSVTIAAGGVQPNIVTINNSTSASYTFAGGDIKGSSIGGGGGLYLAGNGPVTINSNYTAAGPIVSSKSTATGTTLINGNVTASTGVTVNGGTLTLAGTNTYTGNNTVNGGTLAVGADFNLGAIPGTPTANSIVLNSGALKTTASFTLNSNRGITTNVNASTINNDPGTTLTYGGVISGVGGLTQTGGGTLTLSGANTYAGNTTVTNGHMVVSGATAKLGGGNVTVNGANAGTFLTISSGVANAISDFATLTLAGGGTATIADQGYIELGAGINEIVGTLLLGTAAQAYGTYGSTASSAMFKNNEYFSGTGIITVTIPGDYNGNGTVDAADYVMWRDNPSAFGGDPAGYNTWRANFGSSISAAGGSVEGTTSVPEPATLLLLISICSVLCVRRGKS